MKTNFIYAKLLKYAGAHAQGAVIRIKCDTDGVPLSKAWRNRLKDTKIDNSLKIISERQAKKGPILNG